MNIHLKESGRDKSHLLPTVFKAQTGFWICQCVTSITTQIKKVKVVFPLFKSFGVYLEEEDEERKFWTKGQSVLTRLFVLFFMRSTIEQQEKCLTSIVKTLEKRKMNKNLFEDRYYLVFHALYTSFSFLFQQIGPA